MKRFRRGRFRADLAGVTVLMAGVVGTVGVEAAQDPQGRQGGKITPKIAVESHGRRTAEEPLALTEDEMKLCAEGDAAMCRKGYQFYLSRSDMGSARSHSDAVPSEAGVAACEAGSRGACATVAAAMWPHMHQMSAGRNPLYQGGGMSGQNPMHEAGARSAVTAGEREPLPGPRRPD
ncbi:MAG: hypothetical protein DCF28_00850 [Alphaproteobacteria bacterium]|nr:MAG: hypothetical protein DCF28_00850 [Alphaproteobacteria bacterium]